METKEILDKKVIVTGAIALVGNPNVGKSVIFGRLTGTYVTVSNYPGTTVDVTRGNGWFAGKQHEVIDTPGILSLFPKSEDERVTRDLLFRETPETIVQVADAKNLKRSLLITLELAELKIPMVLALNMTDEARERGMEINVQQLSEILGIPVIETIGVTGHGIPELRRAISKAKPPKIETRFIPEVLSARKDVAAFLPEKISLKGQARELPGRFFIAETLLHKDPTIWKPVSEWIADGGHERVKAQTTAAALKIAEKFVRPVALLALDSRQQLSREITAQVARTTGKIEASWIQTLGQMAMRPWPGYLIAGLVLYALYQFVGVFAAQTLVELLEDGLFGKIVNPAVTKLVDVFIPIQFFREMLVGEYGIFTMALTYALALIFPIVSAFFLFFGILEDSGYLPRLAVMLDRVFRVMGLNGKAVLPMILGLGCDTMATLTTRVLDTKKEKVIVALLLTLSVPCSAQLGAMLGMVAGLSGKVFAIWLGVVIGTMIAVGWGASKFLPGLRSPFIMEIPPIRRPQFSNLFKKITARLSWYLREAVPLFILGTMLLFFSDKIGLLEWIKRVASPVVVGFLGLPERATESFIVGFLRRDYGAAGFFMLSQNGLMSPEQVTVALVVITLFMPCIAQFFVTVKERGMKTTLAIVGFVAIFSLGIGGLMHWILAKGWIRL